MRDFEDKIVEAIVRQWFEPKQQINEYGTVIYTATPATYVAAELLRSKQEDIVKAIVAKLDLKKLTTEVADNFYKKITSYDRWDTSTATEFQKLVSDKLATMMAEKIMAEQGKES